MFRPTLSLSRRSSTTRIPASHVSCRRFELQEIGLTLFYIIDQWLLVMSTQLIGFSIGGICKRFLVYPPSMIWPNTLVQTSLFNTMHSLETFGTQGLGGISRGRFFSYVFIGYFFYSRFPSPDLLSCHRVLSSPISRFLAELSIHCPI
jgi:hypothetical protein